MATVQSTPTPTQPANEVKTEISPSQPVAVVPEMSQDTNAPPGYQGLPSQPQPQQPQQVQPTIAQPFMIPAQNNGEKQPLQFLQPNQQPTQFVPSTLQAGTINTTIVADNAISNDAVRMSYAQYITIPNLKGAVVNQIPKELSARGLTQNEYAEVISQVKGIKSKSDNNKIALWTGMIFFCGLIGYLLVSQRAVGNKKLRKQLESPLEEINRKLMNRGVPVRWLWVDGSLRAYYK